MIASTGRDGSRKVICVDIAIPKQPEDDAEHIADLHLLALQDEVQRITRCLRQTGTEADKMDGVITDWAKGAAKRAYDAGKAAHAAVFRKKDGTVVHETPKGEAAHRDPQHITVELPKAYLERMDKIISALTELMITIASSKSPPNQESADTTEEYDNAGPPGPAEGAPMFYIMRTA